MTSASPSLTNLRHEDTVHNDIRAKARAIVRVKATFRASVGLVMCLGAGDGAGTYGGDLNTTSIPG